MRRNKVPHLEEMLRSHEGARSRSPGRSSRRSIGPEAFKQPPPPPASEKAAEAPGFTLQPNRQKQGALAFTLDGDINVSSLNTKLPGLNKQHLPALGTVREGMRHPVLFDADSCMAVAAAAPGFKLCFSQKTFAPLAVVKRWKRKCRYLTQLIEVTCHPEASCYRLVHT